MLHFVTFMEALGQVAPHPLRAGKQLASLFMLKHCDAVDVVGNLIGMRHFRGIIILEIWL